MNYMIDRKQSDDNKIVFSDGDKQVLVIEEFLKDNVIEIIPEGKLRSEITHDFFDEMQALISVGLNVELNLSKVSYVSNSYMKGLIALQQKAEKTDKTIKIVNPSESMKEMLESTGAYALLWIEEEDDQK